MSFICAFCGEQQPNCTKTIKIPTKVSIRPLPPAQKEVDNPDKTDTPKKWIANWSQEERRIVEDDMPKKLIVAWSREERRIVEEKNACPACAANPPKPEIVGIIT